MIIDSAASGASGRGCDHERGREREGALGGCEQVPVLQVCSRETMRRKVTDVDRYNTMWTRDIQNVIFAILLCGWLGGVTTRGKQVEVGKLLTIEEVGEILGGKSRDVTRAVLRPAVERHFILHSQLYKQHQITS